MPSSRIVYSLHDSPPRAKYSRGLPTSVAGQSLVAIIPFLSPPLVLRGRVRVGVFSFFEPPCDCPDFSGQESHHFSTRASGSSLRTSSTRRNPAPGINVFAAAHAAPSRQASGTSLPATTPDANPAEKASPLPIALIAATSIAGTLQNDFPSDAIAPFFPMVMTTHRAPRPTSSITARRSDPSSPISIPNVPANSARFGFTTNGCNGNARNSASPRASKIIGTPPATARQHSA